MIDVSMSRNGQEMIVFGRVWIPEPDAIVERIAKQIAVFKDFQRDDPVRVTA